MSALIEPARCPKGHAARRPTREIVERIATEEALEAGLDPVAVLGASPQESLYSARQKAWLRLLSETRCSVLGLAVVWGCDRKSIQRTRRGFR